MTATWQINPHSRENWNCKILVDDDGGIIGICEDFGYAVYPTALNAKTHNWERGGPHLDGVEAKAWAERVAGLHPTKPSDETAAVLLQMTKITYSGGTQAPKYPVSLETRYHDRYWVVVDADHHIWCQGSREMCEVRFEFWMRNKDIFDRKEWWKR